MVSCKPSASTKPWWLRQPPVDTTPPPIVLSTKPSADTGRRTHRPNTHPHPNQRSPEMVISNRTQGNEWADANVQVDYLTGFNNDAIFRTSAFGLSISPLMSAKPSNLAKPAVQRAYPSQELNSRYGDPHVSNSTSDDGLKPPLLPPLGYPSQELNPRYSDLKLLPSKSDRGVNSHFLPPPPMILTGKCDNQETTLKVPGSPKGNVVFRSGKVTSFPYCPGAVRLVASQDLSDHPERVASIATGLTQDLDDLTTNGDGPSFSVLDSFEIDGLGTDFIATGQSENELPGSPIVGSRPPRREIAARVSTNPKYKVPKKTKGKAKKGATGHSPNGKADGVLDPSPLDILRGRGGLTNRHLGNQKFRDEARKLRADYRNRTTTREQKFLLSQELAKRVKEYGGKFLEQNKEDKLWYEIDARDARKKASQVLREEKWD